MESSTTLLPWLLFTEHSNPTIGRLQPFTASKLTKNTSKAVRHRGRVVEQLLGPVSVPVAPMRPEYGSAMM